MLLVLACVLGVVLSMAAYYDTNLRSGLENRAKTTTDFFSNYIGQSYNEYYQSCIKFAKTFEDKDRLELQFISPGGKIVARFCRNISRVLLHRGLRSMNQHLRKLLPRRTRRLGAWLCGTHRHVNPPVDNSTQ